MLQAPEAILDRFISGLEAQARENWHWFMQSSPRTLYPGFRLFHLGSFGCEKQDSFLLPPKQQCIIKATVNCNSIWKAVRTCDCFRYQCLLFSLSRPLSCSLQLFVQFSFLSVGQFPLTLHLFCSGIILVYQWLVFHISRCLFILSPYDISVPSFTIFNTSEPSDWSNASFHPRSHRS